MREIDPATVRLVPVRSAADGASPFISVKELAALLGLSERKTYDLLRIRVGPDPHDPARSRPLIPHERQGDSYVIHKAEVERYVRRGRLNPWGGAEPVTEGPRPGEERLAEAVISKLIRALSALQQGAAEEWR